MRVDRYAFIVLLVIYEKLEREWNITAFFETLEVGHICIYVLFRHKNV